ncbi:MAG: rhodanese-related sulfurtransferase [Gammaproteobacteria bacterium]|nr:rhodanese-related sulfurtransferase [Gammaproteobacteria bacterium]
MSRLQCVAAFYKFVHLRDVHAVRDELEGLCGERGLRGTLRVAHEGINATLVGEAMALESLVECLRGDPRFEKMLVTYSRAAGGNPVFRYLSVRVRSEIVAFGVNGIDPGAATGRHVSAQDFNALLSDPDVVVVDARNQYETDIGSFTGAQRSGTASFREFPGFAEKHLTGKQDVPIAMCCTGGIRCEKASALLLQRGFRNVYQLDGGILNYLASIDRSDSRWNGELYVFDQRVTVDPALEQGGYVQCHACRRPVSRRARHSESYQAGISCPACYDGLGIAQRRALAERKRQVALAAQRGDSHIGADMTALRARKRVS